ncbi:glycoside hydrolase [Fusarium agapanthi]|uniref:glucan 1,3-beta-glucosidase n=1 Tax=Fusarium agapanthi TaxID=1803897 RepID=A0A9P5B6E6_9HYPO|nr:glycoside hydrolase [Fusarium agapanthi]
MPRLPPLDKLPLAARKNLRDKWQNKLADFEEQLSKAMGVDWKIDIDALAVVPYGAEVSWPRESPGSMIANYVEEVVKELERNPKCRDGINKLASAHVLTMDVDEEETFDACGAKFISDGKLAIVFGADRLGFYTGDAFWHKNLEKGIREDYEPDIADVQSDLKDIIKKDLILVPNFEETYKKLKLTKEGTDFDQYLGAIILNFFRGLVSTLKWRKFDSDDMLQEVLSEALEKGEVHFRILDEVEGSSGEAAIEDGFLYLQTIAKTIGVGRGLIFQNGKLWVPPDASQVLSNSNISALLFSTAAAAPQPDYSVTSSANHGKVAKYQKQCPFSIPHVKPHNQRYEHTINFPKGCESGKFIIWKTYKANGINLGAWLAKEKTHDPVWWNSLGTKAAATIDEWGLCQALGKQCGPMLEKRYESFLNTSTIDTLSKVGVPGSAFYHGRQQDHLQNITQYAIERYNMHIIIGIHSLSGGVNNLDIGEAFGHDGWFYNSTNLAWSFNAFDKVLDFVKTSGHKNAFTIAPLNEVSDNLAGFGSAAGLSDKATNWVLTYMNGVFQRVEDVDKRIPVMLQDNFKGAAFWSALFDKKRSLVIDSHVYYFAASGTYS